MTLAERIRTARKERQLSQEALAHRARMSLRAFRSLETGEADDPHYSTLNKLAVALGVSVADLVGEKPLVPLGEDVSEWEEEGLTDEEITRILTGPVTTGETISEADMKKLLQYDNGNIVISALEELCDLAEHGLNSNRFKLDDLEILEEHVSGQYYSHKYDPRRGDIFWRGTPQQKAALEREETRIDEVLAALQKAYSECLEREQLPEDELYARRQAQEAMQQKHSERPGERLIRGIGA